MWDENQKLLVLPLHEARAQQRSRVGSKAAALGTMLEAGLPVPPGFCITTAAFQRVLTATDALPAIAALDRTPPGNDLVKLGDAVRARLATAPIPADLEQAIVAAWRGPLRAVACAVRSSATAEDLHDMSFAGQLDTVLNVCGGQALLQAVRHCWSSLFSERALAYRARRGLKNAGVEMAVIVQELVYAEAAGVMFTMNPLSGREDQIVIEASYGLGEGLVSGRVSPDRFVIRKDTHRIIEQSVSNKTRAIMPDGDNRVIEQAIAPDAARRAALSDTTAQRLAQLGTDAERLFGAPQDVEWAAIGVDVFALQSRPITTRHQDSSHRDDGQVWTNMNTGEVLPDVVSPLTWSFLERTAVRCLNDAIAGLGVDLNQCPLFGRIAGRIYFNLNTLVAIGRTLPSGANFDVTPLAGGFQSETEVQRCLAILEQNLPQAQLARRKLLRRLPAIVVWCLRHHGSAGAERCLTRFGDRVDARQRRNLETLSESSLLEELHHCVELFLDEMVTLGSYAMVGISYFPYLQAACNRWFPDQPNVANELVTGVGGMASAEAGLDMWRLATFAHARAAVAQTLATSHEFAAARPALAGIDGGTDFLQRWDAFMQRHGHHARGEVELMNRRWADDPDYVLAQVRSYLSSMGGKDPVATCRAQAEERDRRATVLRHRLRNPLKRILFDFLLRRAQRGIVYRENAKSEGVRVLAFTRQVALALGRLLAARGVIEQPDHVFFLDLDELTGSVREAALPLRDVVIGRRAEFERNVSTTPPPVVIGTFDAARIEAEMVAAHGDRLYGVGVSPGVVTGPARVILRSDAHEQVLPGEILVAPFTDPGWTPYFQLAAGLVTDLGGLLSHGSIVAREYGLPAVVNVGPATSIIRSGDVLQLDGTRGEVRIVQRVDPPPAADRDTADLAFTR